MINKLELKKLPFVDDCPEADQKRIPWVRNGECLTAATTKYGHDGVLNGAGVGIHTNTLTLEQNAETTKDTMNIVIDNVNNINKALEMGADTDVIKQIAQNKENIEILQVHMQFAENNIGTLETDVDFLKEDVGVYDPSKDSVLRPIRDDLLFIKTEIGQYEGQDINGIPVSGNEATGMKRQIIDTSTELVSVRTRVKKLEDDYQDSDVGSLSIKLNEIRDELGPHVSSVGKPTVYARLDSLETITSQSDQTISEIKTAIGLGTGPSINTRMNAVEGRTQTLENTVNLPITGLVARVSKIETDIGTVSVPSSINGRIASLRTDLDANIAVVGKDTSSGLRKQVSDLQTAVGQDTNPASTSLRGRMTTVEGRTGTNSSSIQDIQAEIGTTNTGMKGSITKLSSQMNGTNPQGTTVKERGVFLSVEQLDTRVANMPQEAPNDGQAYVRQNGAWVLLSTFLTP